MIIECTRCHTRAKLPDSKEGAKVRCPECGHVYVASAGGGRPGARKKEDPTKYFIIGGAILVFGIIAVIASKGGRSKAPPDVAAAPAEQVSLPPTQGFDAPLVKEARDLHNYAAASNVAAMLLKIDFPAVHAWEQGRAAAPTAADPEGAEGGDEAALPDPGPADPRSWAELTVGEQQVYKNGVMDGLGRGRWRDLVADWLPYDGHVVEDTQERGTVRVLCHHRDLDLGLDDRWVEWRFVRDGERWKAVAWERWISPEEEQVARARRAKTTVKRTLADGSEVIEGEVSTRFVEWHEETPQELRDEIEALIDVLIDLDTPAKGLTSSRMRLEEIGKHAVAGLLLRIATISPDMGPAGSEIAADFQLTEDQAVQINLMHMLLQDITGHLTTYDVHAAMGTTAERQGSGIRQWFGWYDKKFKKFWRTEDEIEVDPFFDDPDFLPRNERERREFEEYRRKLKEQGKGDG